MKILIINGPNINMLGIREPEIYGKMTYNDLTDYIKAHANNINVNVEFFQSNHEGAIVDVIQNAYNNFDAIVINPAAYTHTSIAILDALKSVGLPCAEVHISDVLKRESFRHHSYVSSACNWHFIGQGKQGYINAINNIKTYLNEKEVK